MECSDQDRTGALFLPRRFPQALTHLFRCLIRKCYRSDLGRTYPPVFQKIPDPGCQGLCFARSRPGFYRDCRRYRDNGMFLLRIQRFPCRRSPLLLHLRLFFRRSRGCPGILFSFRFYFFITCAAQQAEEIHLSFHIIQLIRAEQPDNAILSVKSRNALHLAAAEPSDAFRNSSAGYPADVLQRKISQNLKFRPQPEEHFLILFPHLSGCRRAACGSADHLWKGHKALKSFRVFPDIALLPVGQLFHTVRDPYGQFSSAHRAFSSVFHSFRRSQTQAAFPVSVHMILAFLREKLYGPGKPFSGLNRPAQPFVGHDAVQEICLPPQFCRGVSVRIGDQLILIKRGNPPVHRRIRGQPSLHRMDIRSQIFKALLHRIKPGECAEQRKMRRPDMGGDIYRRRTQFQHNFKQIMTVQPQNRASVGVDVSDLFQLPGYPLRVFQSGEQDQAVDFPHPAVFLINGTDLSRNDKPRDNLSRYAAVPDTVLLFQYIQPFLRRRQFFLQLLTPGRMCKISGPHNMDPFAACPQIQMLRSTVFAGGSGISGMNM